MSESLVSSVVHIHNKFLVSSINILSRILINAFKIREQMSKNWCLHFRILNYYYIIEFS